VRLGGVDHLLSLFSSSPLVLASTRGCEAAFFGGGSSRVPGFPPPYLSSPIRFLSRAVKMIGDGPSPAFALVRSFFRFLRRRGRIFFFFSATESGDRRSESTLTICLLFLSGWHSCCQDKSGLSLAPFPDRELRDGRRLFLFPFSSFFFADMEKGRIFFLVFFASPP